MELSTIINAESSSLQKLFCLRVDVATLVTKLANGGRPDSFESFIVPDKLLDKFEDVEEKVRVLEQHRDYLKFNLQEQQEQHIVVVCHILRRDDSKSRLEDKSSIGAVGHDLKTN